MNELESLINNMTQETNIDNFFKEEIGIVLSVNEETCICNGLINAFINEVVYFENKDLSGIVIGLTEYTVKVLILGDSTLVKAQMEVSRSKKVFSVTVSDELIGNALNGFGKLINGEKISGKELPIFNEAPTLMERAGIDKQLFTGVNAIDLFMPIGYGQREAILGNRGIGKTAILENIIINAKSRPNDICIYVAIGQSKNNTKKFLNNMKIFGVTNYIMIIADASNSATMKYLAPYVGCSIAEYFRDKGKNAILLIDDLLKHAEACREISLLLQLPQGREAYPGDIFYQHSSLLERAAHMKNGGSLTIFPVVEIIEGDIAAYIPTNIISITDGQIILDNNKFNRGIKPAINIGMSVSRIGTHIQPPYLRELCKSLKLKLAQAEEYEQTKKIGADISPDIAAIIDYGISIKQTLLQPYHKPLTPEKLIILLYAVKILRIKEVKEFMKILLETETISDYTEEYAKIIAESIKEELNESLHK